MKLFAFLSALLEEMINSQGDDRVVEDMKRSEGECRYDLTVNERLFVSFWK